jgi:hypothetical protein
VIGVRRYAQLRPSFVLRNNSPVNKYWFGKMSVLLQFDNGPSWPRCSNAKVELYFLVVTCVPEFTMYDW